MKPNEPPEEPDPMEKSVPFNEITEFATHEMQNIWEPNIDIGETPSAYIIVAELPGVRSEHLNLIYEQGLLTIDAKAPPKGYHQWQHVFRDEREKGRCFRMFALPDDVDVEGRREKLHQGLLTIHLPKLATSLITRTDPHEGLESAMRQLPQELSERVTKLEPPQQKLPSA